MLEKIVLLLIFLLSFASTILYFLGNGNTKRILIARWLLKTSFIGIIGISGFLLYNILTHNYQFTYIWENSSNQLPWYLLLSSFFAGQEGSFLLWLSLLSVIGFFFQRSSQKNNYEEISMGLFGLLITIILLILVIKNPFDYIWETYKDNGVAIGFMPINGRGLNPILENIWMVIHPPILFLGYSFLTIPFILAITSLYKKDHSHWINFAYPWIITSSAVLGLGIMLGGFWAYETLGWGGFWGWDPVENSSLLPWLTSIAFIHTIIIQRKTNALKITNYILAIVTFLLVLYASFLTRSGILGDSSVHSFTNPGTTVYTILLILLIIFFLIGAYSLISNTKSIKSEKLNTKLQSRELMLTLGAVFILLTSVIVFLGTSWPIITEVFAQNKSSVSTSFYNSINTPLIILILISNAVSLYLGWKEESLNKLLKKILIPVLASIITVIVLFFFGANEISSSVILFAVFFSLIVNVTFAITTLVKNPLGIGGFLSHTGISLIMIGIVGSGVYSTANHFQIKNGETKQIAGLKYTFVDKIQIDKMLPDRQKFKYRISLEQNGKKSFIEPTICWSDFNNRKSPIIEPGIIRFFLKDVYITLKSADVDNSIISKNIEKNKTILCPLDTSIKITLLQYDMSHSTMTRNSKIELGAVVKIKFDSKELVDTIYTIMDEASVYTDVKWYNIHEKNINISFLRFFAAQDDLARSDALLGFKKANEPYIPPVEILTLEASVKPFISFVWIGVCSIILGFLVSLLKNKFKK